MQVRFVDENGKYSYAGCTEPRFATDGANALIDRGVFFAGHDNGERSCVFQNRRRDNCYRWIGCQ